jgi:hypothetical protein
VVEYDEDERESSPSTEDPNINYRDVDDDGMDVEDDIANRTLGGLTFRWGVSRTLHQI